MSTENKRERRSQDQIRLDNFNEHLVSLSIQDKVKLVVQLRAEIDQHVADAKAAANEAIKIAEGLA